MFHGSLLFAHSWVSHMCAYLCMRVRHLVGSLKTYVSFAKERPIKETIFCKRDLLCVRIRAFVCDTYSYMFHDSFISCAFMCDTYE